VPKLKKSSLFEGEGEFFSRVLQDFGNAVKPEALGLVQVLVRGN
jgi:hypothetical protein